MSRKKKLVIVGVVAAALLLMGSLAGVALANTGATADGSSKTFAARVAALLGIEPQKVEDAFKQAEREIADEALDNRLKAMVDNGKMTQDQADKYKTWWKARPDDLPAFGPLGPVGPRGIIIGPDGAGPEGFLIPKDTLRRGFRGFRGFRAFGGWGQAPSNPAN